MVLQRADERRYSRARAERDARGLSCFLVPRVLADGTRNPFAIARLKNKLGNRSNASAEVEFDATPGWLIGDEGEGIRDESWRWSTIRGWTARSAPPR